jgi:hypothetical protein
VAKAKNQEQEQLQNHHTFAVRVRFALSERAHVSHLRCESQGLCAPGTSLPRRARFGFAGNNFAAFGMGYAAVFPAFRDFFAQQWLTRAGYTSNSLTLTFA